MLSNIGLVRHYRIMPSEQIVFLQNSIYVLGWNGFFWWPANFSFMNRAKGILELWKYSWESSLASFHWSDEEANVGREVAIGQGGGRERGGSVTNILSGCLEDVKHVRCWMIESVLTLRIRSCEGSITHLTYIINTETPISPFDIDKTLGYFRIGWVSRSTIWPFSSL